MSNGYRNGAFALGLVTGVGIALNLFLWLEYQDQRTSDQKASTNGEQGGEQVAGWLDRFIGTFVSPSDTLAQWIMAIFTIAVVILVWRTLVATQEMARDTREIGRIQNMAYVSIESASMCFTTEAERSAVTWIGFHNSGHVAAERFDYCADVVLKVHTGETLCFAMNHHPSTTHVSGIPPGGSETKKALNQNVTLPKIFWEELTRRTPHAGQVEAKILVKYAFDTIGRREYREVALIGQARFLHDNDVFSLTLESNIRNLKLVEDT